LNDLDYQNLRRAFPHDAGHDHQEAVCLQVVAGARFELWTRPLTFEFVLNY